MIESSHTDEVLFYYVCLRVFYPLSGSSLDDTIKYIYYVAMRNVCAIYLNILFTFIVTFGLEYVADGSLTICLLNMNIEYEY
jgi:hypothetical protein